METTQAIPTQNTFSIFVGSNSVQLESYNQCDQIWQTFKTFGHFMKVWQNMNLLCKILYGIENFFYCCR